MMNPTLRFLARIAALALVLVLLGGLFLRSRPNLDGLDRLLAAGQFQAAEQQLTDYLDAYPGEESARILLARASVDRPDAKPEFALAQLEGLEPAEQRRAAQVRAIRGQAYFHQRRFDRAEAAWLDALGLDPAIAEVGWGLLNVYSMQGRFDDSRKLALRLYPHEPDAHDRLQLLLQMIRHDAHAMALGPLVHQLEPVVQAHPDEIATSLALGTVLVQVGRGAEGLDLLRKMVQEHPDRPEPWVHLAEVLVDSGQPDELAKLIAQAPASARDLPRVLSARAWLAMQRQQWPEAADLGLAAFARRSDDPTIAYRLKIALDRAGRKDDLARLGPRLQAAAEVKDKLCVLYDRLDAGPEVVQGGPPEALKHLGQGPPSESYRQLAAILREVGRTEEADLWDRQAGAEAHRGP